MDRAYARFFATWLGANQVNLLVPATNDTKKVQGVVLVPEERLFFVAPLLVISEVILGIYVVVSIVMYLRRPDRYLPRMPTSIAVTVALFAPSAAVKRIFRAHHA